MIFERDQLFRVVCNIRIPMADRAKEEIGTGLFVNKGADFFLITASHVVKNHNSQTAVILSNNDGNATRLSLATLSGDNQWVHHPVADLAYIRLTPNEANKVHLQNRFFPFDHIHLVSQPVSRDVELTSIGFPLGLGSAGKYSPLSFRTFAASPFLTLNRFDNNKPSEFFILENPSVGGYSGGPVFDLGYIVSALMTQRKERTVCYGIMHGTIADETGGKMAAVTPSHYLHSWI